MMLKTKACENVPSSLEFLTNLVSLCLSKLHLKINGQLNVSLKLPHRYAVKTDSPCMFPSIIFLLDHLSKLLRETCKGGSDFCFHTYETLIFHTLVPFTVDRFINATVK